MYPYILVLDDIAMVREMLCEILRKHGYNCIAVGTVSEAVEAASKQLPQLAFVDYWLTDGATGPSVVPLLRALPGGSTLPIIGFSGLEKEAEPAFRKVEVNGFVRKPLRDEPVLDVLNLFLGEGASFTS